MTVDEVVEAAGILVGRWSAIVHGTDHMVFSPTWKIEVHRRGVAAYVGAESPGWSASLSTLSMVPWSRTTDSHRDLAELESDAIAYAEAMDVNFATARGLRMAR